MDKKDGKKSTEFFYSRYVFIVLFILGLMGSFMLILLNRDMTAAIMMGYGFSLLDLRHKAEEKTIKPTQPWVAAFIIVCDLISIPSIIYSTVRFPTGFNKVICAGFVILQLWNTYILYHDYKK